MIAAAGSGARLGGAVPKQFLPIAGVPLLLRALRPFLAHPEVADVVAVLPRDDAGDPPPWLATLVGERLRLTPGGTTRAESVAAGLAALGQGCAIVLVHDGARPFPVPEVIDAVIQAARSGVGATAAVPLSDTLKEAGLEPPPSSTPATPQLVVSRTVPRDSLWRAQTPQGFPRAMLENAYAAAKLGGWTDEAELVERSGGRVVLIGDSVVNLKVTTADDLRLAEAVAQSVSP